MGKTIMVGAQIPNSLRQRVKRKATLAGLGKIIEVLYEEDPAPRPWDRSQWDGDRLVSVMLRMDADLWKRLPPTKQSWVIAAALRVVGDTSPPTPVDDVTPWMEATREALSTRTGQEDASERQEDPEQEGHESVDTGQVGQREFVRSDPNGVPGDSVPVEVKENALVAHQEDRLQPLPGGMNRSTATAAWQSVQVRALHGRVPPWEWTVADNGVWVWMGDLRCPHCTGTVHIAWTMEDWPSAAWCRRCRRVLLGR